MPTLNFLKWPQHKLYSFLEENSPSEIKIFLWLDVAKSRLDVSLTSNDGFQVYLWTVWNNVTWYRTIEEVIIKMIALWVHKKNIYFAVENTWVFWNDTNSFFSSRLENTYILNSILSYRYRQFYSKGNDWKNDPLDSMIVSLLLQDLHSKKLLEDDTTPYKKNKTWLGFVRRSSFKEVSSLRMLYRRQASLRSQKSKIMTRMNAEKYRIFPELTDIFKIKNRASSEMVLIRHFTREDILCMDKKEFMTKYRSFATKGQQVGQVLKKIEKFYDAIHDRWEKTHKSALDVIINDDANIYIKNDIIRSLRQYDLIVDDMKDIQDSIINILAKLKAKWFYIPTFNWINDSDMGIFLGEFGSDIYTIGKKEMLWFIGWHPVNYSSGGSTVKQSKLSKKKNVIKSYLYLWTYGLYMHNPSFKLYKTLLSEYYGISENTETIVNLKNKRKVQAKAWQKLLTIILRCYQSEKVYDENWFIQYTIRPLIKRLMEEKWYTEENIQSHINLIYKKKTQPQIL